MAFPGTKGLLPGRSYDRIRRHSRTVIATARAQLMRRSYDDCCDSRMITDATVV
ncbi:MAG: hypothetical protein K2N13_05075 [Paraprevotella sp.]|nr:hypothetical protein [Paraprevotella sp.]